jgi:2-amino-4-hydroxy-6-hydroxymethyldihydropteridine diphosphokinase
MDPASRTSPLRFQALSGVQTAVVVGLGANLGAPAEEFVRALAGLQRVLPLVAVSPLYRSAPFGPKQPDYLNAGVLLDSSLPLPSLLAHLKALEAAAGRVRGERWGPRPLDLDILWAGDHVLKTSSLTVPHPELRRRAFALRPLLDLFPSASDPVSGQPYAAILRQLEPQVCERVEGEKWWDEVIIKEPFL